VSVWCGGGVVGDARLGRHAEHARARARHARVDASTRRARTCGAQPPLEFPNPGCKPRQRGEGRVLLYWNARDVGGSWLVGAAPPPRQVRGGCLALGQAFVLRTTTQTTTLQRQAVCRLRRLHACVAHVADPPGGEWWRVGGRHPCAAHGMPRDLVRNPPGRAPPFSRARAPGGPRPPPEFPIVPAKTWPWTRTRIVVSAVCAAWAEAGGWGRRRHRDHRLVWARWLPRCWPSASHFYHHTTTLPRQAVCPRCEGAGASCTRPRPPWRYWLAGWRPASLRGAAHPFY
jgi:hypothetical protein